MPISEVFLEGNSYLLIGSFFGVSHLLKITSFFRFDVRDVADLRTWSDPAKVGYDVMRLSSNALFGGWIRSALELLLSLLSIVIGLQPFPVLELSLSGTHPCPAGVI